MDICHFFYLLHRIIVTVFTRYFKGHFENLSIGNLVSASILISATQKKNFSLTKLFWKNKTFTLNTLQYSFLCLIVWHLYHFATTTTHFSTISYSSIKSHQLMPVKSQSTLSGKVKICQLHFCTYSYIFLLCYRKCTKNNPVKCILFS